MLHDEKTEPGGWRKNWLVKNILAEVPIFGSFFYTSKKLEMAKRALQSTTLLSCAGIFMALDVLSIKETDSAAIKTAKMATVMGISIFATNVAFNCFKSLGKVIYERCTKEEENLTMSEKMLH